MQQCSYCAHTPTVELSSDEMIWLWFCCISYLVMSTNVSLWMPAILRCMLSIILLLCVSNLRQVNGKCSFQWHSSYFHSTLFPSFHCPQKKICIEFSANYSLTTLRILYSAKYPFPIKMVLLFCSYGTVKSCHVHSVSLFLPTKDLAPISIHTPQKTLF